MSTFTPPEIENAPDSVVKSGSVVIIKGKSTKDVDISKAKLPLQERVLLEKITKKKGIQWLSVLQVYVPTNNGYSTNLVVKGLKENSLHKLVPYELLVKNTHKGLKNFVLYSKGAVIPLDLLRNTLDDDINNSPTLLLKIGNVVQLEGKCLSAKRWESAKLPSTLKAKIKQIGEENDVDWEIVYTIYKPATIGYNSNLLIEGTKNDNDFYLLYRDYNKQQKPETFDSARIDMKEA